MDVMNDETAAGNEPAAVRDALLERYGHVYGELGLAIAFTRSISGEDAKRCGAGWDKTDPLPDGPFGAALLKGRGAKHNPAVVLRRSSLVGIECDTPEGLEQILALDLPATVTVQSSAPHKLHFWFRPPNGSASYAAFRLERAGVCADKGRYLLCPPALHPSGAVYAFLREPPETEIATLPQSRYDELVRLATENRQQLRSQLSGNPDAKISEGQRRETIFRFACSQRAYGVPPDALLEAAKALNRDRCAPPLADDQVAHQVHGALQYEPATTLQFSIPPPIALKTGGNETDGGLQATPIESLIENVPPEPEWVWRGYVAPFAVSLLAGRPKVGKSTFVFALLSRLVAGAPFVGLETVAAGVLVLTEERRDTLAEKARILGLVSIPPRTSPIGGNKRPAHVLLRHEAGSIPWPELVRQAMAYCHQHELRCLVVDTWDRWTSLRGDAENAAGAVNEALEPLQYAAASGLAVLIVSHQRKSLGEFGEAVRGSNALTGGVDVVLELERPAPRLALGKHARALRAVSRFSSTPDELYVELDEEAAAFVAIESPEEVKAALEQTRIVEVLAGLDGATSAAVAETIELPDSTVRRHLNVLLERGHVVREGQGKRGNPFRWRAADTENDE